LEIFSFRWDEEPIFQGLFLTLKTENLKLSGIADEVAWLAMLADRNLTSHTYDEALAQAVYSRLRQHLSLLQELKNTLSELE
jgi:nucleotidyltransferase substrate binding protein (TIGR01987 family)